MRLLPVLPAAALVAVIGVGAPMGAAYADSPVVIEGVDADMRQAILDLLPDREAPTTLFDAERLAEEAATRVRLWLRAEGYYASTVATEALEEPAAARLVITPGRRFRFAALQIAYADEPPSAEAQVAVREAANGIAEDAAARSAAILDAEAEALAALQRAGYADATVGERRVIVDHAAFTVTTQLAFVAQQRASLGTVRAEPEDIFRDGFLHDLQNWERGDTYSPDALARIRRDLAATGAVSAVSTRLDEPGADGTRDVVLAVEPARRNAYEVGLSYSTTEGLGVQGEWTRRNLTGRADALTATATLAEMQQGVGLQLRRPHAAGLGHAITVGAAAERETLDAFTRQGASIFASVDAGTRLRLARTYGVSLSADTFDDLSGNISQALVLSGFASLRRDTTNFSLDARDGAITELRVEPSVSSGDETSSFVRAIGEARAYESFGREDALTLAARIRGAWLEATTGSVEDVPPDRRFYAGGGGSVRGYEYNSIYPQERDALGLTPGGQGLLEGSLEARWRFGERWGLVGFVDGGTAFDEWSDAGDLSWGAGIGVRYDLGFAPLRFDVAVPLDRDESGNDFALYVSLGQAF